MRWMNAPMTAARRLPRSGTPARQAEHRGDALPDLQRGDVVQPVDPGRGEEGESFRQIGNGDDAATPANPGPIDSLDPGPGLGRLRLRHVDRA
jgi:hypothetical protein